MHYPEYYQSGKTEDLLKESPKPNTFPAVEKGARYAFCIVANRMETVDDELFDKARAVLVEAITVSGIGAKTGAGYGWFKDVTLGEEEKAKKDQLEKEAKKQKEEEAARELARKAEEKVKAEQWAAMTPQERILDEWSRLNVKAIVNGRYISKFSSLSDGDKRGVVETLRKNEGISAEVWAAIKGVWEKDFKKKLRNPQVESAIRGYCKNTLNLGKMP